MDDDVAGKVRRILSRGGIVPNLKGKEEGITDTEIREAIKHHSLQLSSTLAREEGRSVSCAMTVDPRLSELFRSLDAGVSVAMG